MSPALAFAVGLASFGVPLGVILWQVLVPAGNPREEIARVIATGALALLAFLAAPWVFTSYYLRFVLLAGFAVGALRALFQLRQRPPRVAPRGGHRVAQTLTALVGLGALSLDALVIRGFYYAGTPVALAFPLKAGTYYVLQGGNSPLTNPFHSTDPRGRFALDIVKLNRLGNRARRLIPARLEDYETFGEVIYSPCTGLILGAQDGRADNQPPRPDLREPAGNHVLLHCRGVTVLLAHMRQGSVLPRAGERVEEGQSLGSVGNSGNTSEPHLHLQAMKAAGGPLLVEREAVPMLFDGRFLVLNSVIVR